MITVFVSIIQKVVLKVMFKNVICQKIKLKYVCEKLNLQLSFQLNKNKLTVSLKL